MSPVTIIPSQPFDDEVPDDDLSLGELKVHLDRTLETSDPMLQQLLDAARLQLEAPRPYGTGRLFTPNPEAGGDPVEIELPIEYGSVRVPDARSLTEVSVDGTVVESYRALERNDKAVEIFGLPCGCTAQLTGRFGFLGVPNDLRVAVYVMIAHHLSAGLTGFADRVVAGEGAAASVYYRAIPPRTEMVFESYRPVIDRGIA